MRAPVKLIGVVLSTVYNIYSKRRNKLSTAKAEKLVYVHSNLKLFNQISESDATSLGDTDSKVDVTYCIDFLDKVEK